MFGLMYNYTVISVTTLLYAGEYGSVPTWASDWMEAIVFLGSIVGMLGAGYFGDQFGRAATYVTVLEITVVGAAACAAFTVGSETTKFAMVILTRFVLGVGVGGVYPLSGAENFEEARSGGEDCAGSVQAAWALFWQIPGQILPYVLGLLIFHGSAAAAETRGAWIRGLYLVGALPALLVLPLARGHEDTPEHTQTRAISQRRLSLTEKKSSEEVEQEAVTAPLFTVIWAEHGPALLGCGLSWFFYNALSYGVLLYTDTLLLIVWGDGDPFHAVMWQSALCSTLGIPAYIAAIYLIAPLTPRTLQMLGFGIQAGLCFSLAASVTLGAPTNVLFALFLSLRASLFFGPMATVFILPNELFPAGIRSTCNGISAAVGKVGAFVGIFGVDMIFTYAGDGAAFAVCGCVACCGLLTTLALIPVESLSHPVTSYFSTLKVAHQLSRRSISLAGDGEEGEGAETSPDDSSDHRATNTASSGSSTEAPEAPVGGRTSAEGEYGAISQSGQ